jgi:hypothetical protein
MDRVEAKWLMLRSLTEYRRYSYSQLRTKIGDPRHVELVGASGSEYQLEVECIWDAKPDGDIRVIAGIDDARWRAFCPLGYDFLVSPPIS